MSAINNMTNNKISTKIGVQAFFIIFDIILIMLISFLFYITKPVQTEKIIQIPKGSISVIITQLSEQNSGILPSFDKYILQLFGLPQFGWIDMKKSSLTKADYLYKLTNSKAALTSITLIPGETTIVFLNELSKSQNLSFEKMFQYFKELSPINDGFIVPETYNIPIGIDEKNLIAYLINTSKKHHEKSSKEIFGTYDEEKWFRYLIIASIIQKEAANNDEMPIVSSVVYNRLKINMKLQMDGSLNYGKYSHIRVTPRMIKEDTSRFNTYLHYGLPLYPICAVSKYALNAAIFPANTKYLYFVKGKDGKHIFTNTYNEHVENIKNP